MILPTTRRVRLRPLVLALALVIGLSGSLRTAQAGDQRQPFAAMWAAGSILSLGVSLSACPVAGIDPFATQTSSAMRGALRAASIVATPLYFALKTALAAGGATLGVGMLLLTLDPDYAQATVDRGGKGDWVTRPEHVTCERPIELLGPVAKDPGEESDFPYPID